MRILRDIKLLFNPLKIRKKGNYKKGIIGFSLAKLDLYLVTWRGKDVIRSLTIIPT